MPLFPKINGSHKEMTDGKVKVGGEWKQGVEMLVKVNGVWKQIWSNIVVARNFNLSVNQSNFTENATFNKVTTAMNLYDISIRLLYPNGDVIEYTVDFVQIGSNGTDIYFREYSNSTTMIRVNATTIPNSNTIRFYFVYATAFSGIELNVGKIEVVE